jgi:CheY-like chemotaxis protein
MPASITPGVAAPSHDDLVFLDEAPLAPSHAHRSGWRVLIVDDDADVHSTTTFALAGLEVQDRPLEFLHAYSGHEARALLAREPDIAVILLDVVMEQPEAGLHLVRHVRETLGMQDVRIILRTGQPGYTPEMEAIRDLDINDYRTKSELTRTKLYTTVAAAVRAYQQLHALGLGRAGLERIVHAGTELMRLHGARDVARSVLQQAAALLGQDAAGVLCAREGNALRVLAGAGAALHLEGQVLDAAHDPLLCGAAARALAERRAEFSPTCLALYFPGKSGRDFACAIPLAHAVGEGIQRLLSVFASVVAVGLDNVELVGRLNRAAFFDQLTGLPNRTQLVEELDNVMAAPDSGDATLTLVDLDHFAESNDALGHQYGDQ